MHVVEIVCRASVFTPARVFPTPPPSPCYLPLQTVLFVRSHELHPDSWLFSISCWLSFLCGCAWEVNQGRMLRLMRRCSAVDEELDGSRITMAVAVADAVDVFGGCNFVCVFGLQLLVGPFVVCLSWPIFCLFIC
ncbi:hypothetical protein D8674_006351 [Pyrus ussuriensis x Pyrus communis]|uniref:Uncharacterized protein n=1 Tax=Pyrus ussuriensis x Pyrus communis TaxID=2448454 RepID=A0A5N5G7Q9_9ROSA|nr:hypothetical protein D8674_006351 [Pyrus ussuriensis x Pyrus communis]